MKLTTKSEYSILALIAIARGRDSWIKVDDICDRYNIPKKYLEQLLSILKQNRLIKSRRGAAGGFQLARSATQITLAEIFRMMDGALAPTGSVSQYFYESTPIGQELKVLKIMKEIRDYVATRLENITLQDIL